MLSTACETTSAPPRAAVTRSPRIYNALEFTPDYLSQGITENNLAYFSKKYALADNWGYIDFGCLSEGFMVFYEKAPIVA